MILYKLIIHVSICLLIKEKKVLGVVTHRYLLGAIAVFNPNPNCRTDLRQRSYRPAHFELGFGNLGYFRYHFVHCRYRAYFQ